MKYTNLYYKIIYNLYCKNDYHSLYMDITSSGIDSILFDNSGNPIMTKIVTYKDKNETDKLLDIMKFSYDMAKRFKEDNIFVVTPFFKRKYKKDVVIRVLEDEQIYLNGIEASKIKMKK